MPYYRTAGSTIAYKKLGRLDKKGGGREGITPRAEDADNAGRQDVTGAPRATDFKTAAPNPNFLKVKLSRFV